MTTSGQYSLAYDLNDILIEAFQVMQVLGDGQSLKGDMFNRGKKSLNMMLKAWEQQGIHLWTYQEGTLFLDKSVSEYPFSSAKLANSYTQTTLDGAESVGQTVLSITSTSGMANNDIIGIVTSDNDIHWSTVSSFVANDTVTIADALTVAASSGAVVFYYTPSSFKPVSRVLSVRRKDSSGYEVPIQYVSRETYMNQPNKASAGTPVLAYYSRQETTGTMYVWPAPNDASLVMPFTYERKIQVMVDSDDTFDLPESWFEAVVYNLALRLPFKYGCSATRWSEIKAFAKESLDNALGFDTALTPMTVKLER